MPLKNVFIFDLDGTLVDSYRAIRESLNSARAELGYSGVSLIDVIKNIGNGDKLFINHFFNGADRVPALTRYRRHHGQSLRAHVRRKPYALVLLKALKRKKCKLAIASNRPRYFTNIVLATLKINECFDVVCCADEVGALKPNPKILRVILRRLRAVPAQAFFIGDMAVDLETARRAKIDAVFVRGGSSTLAQAREYRDIRIVSDLRHIIGLCSLGADGDSRLDF